MVRDLDGAAGRTDRLGFAFLLSYRLGFGSMNIERMPDYFEARNGQTSGYKLVLADPNIYVRIIKLLMIPTNLMLKSGRSPVGCSS